MTISPDAPAARAVWPPVSVVMPVLDEERHLRDAVSQVLAQDYPGELELVMALGPSRDRTDEIAAELVAEHAGRVRTVPNPSGTTPAALNAAIAAARHGIVIRVDGHALFPADYVRTAVEVLEETGADNVGGIMAAEGVTPFEQAVARAMTSTFGVGSARFHTGGAAGPADTVYLGVFRRGALERVGGYDESYLRAQDWDLNLRIRRSGGVVWFTPRLRVSYRPRPTLGDLARQYFDYGRWRRTVMRRNQGTATLRYLAPPTLLAGLAAAAVAAPFWPPALLVPAGYLGLVVAASVWTGSGLQNAARVRLLVVYPTMHLSWAAGFLTSPRSLAATPSAEPRPVDTAA